MKHGLNTDKEKEPSFNKRGLPSRSLKRRSKSVALGVMASWREFTKGQFTKRQCTDQIDQAWAEDRQDEKPAFVFPKLHPCSIRVLSVAKQSPKRLPHLARDAFSSNPEVPNRRASSASTWAKFTLHWASMTSR